MALRPAHVHPHEHLGEVRGVDATGLRTDGDQRLALVVLAGEQGADLERGDVLAQLGALGVRVRDGTLVALVLRELVEHREVVDAAPEVLESPQVTLGVGEPAGDLLCGLGVVPEVGLARLVREVRDLRAQRGQVGDLLDALQGGGEFLQVGCCVGIHSTQGYV